VSTSPYVGFLSIARCRFSVRFSGYTLETG